MLEILLWPDAAFSLNKPGLQRLAKQSCQPNKQYALSLALPSLVFGIALFFFF